MLPFRKIIAPTDFSDPARTGVSAAVELAAAYSAELILVYAVPRLPLVPAPNGAGAAGQVALEQDIRESAQKALEETVGQLPEGVAARHRVLSGDPAGQIVQAAREEGADLIVMATHGETGWRRFVSGSVAEKVVRLAECPVLSVHSPGQPED
ncbi:MAG: universal stress protein [Desulfobacterales bacterium]|jgi:nucleotide-binding universal stress UspA family protein